MATNLFSKAAAYRKKHPGMSMPDAVKAVSKKSKKSAKVSGHRHHKRKAPKKRAAPKKRTAAKKAAPAPRKVKKLKIHKAKHGISFSISGISMDKIRHEHTHQRALQSNIKRHQAQLKLPGQTKQEKDHLRREIKAYRGQISASKKHISVLKRSI